ncbi:MAG: helix-turn-helix domain-containing protein [Armatimonadetes bacterium]|nr:helix-turn-helix domain-containing protein [Armatimonadota bacterium]
MPEILTTEQAAIYLQLSPDAVKRLARLGRLPGAKVGRGWRFRKVDLDGMFVEAAVDRVLAEEAERRAAEATEEDFVSWEEVKAKSEALP